MVRATSTGTCNGMTLTVNFDIFCCSLTTIIRPPYGLTQFDCRNICRSYYIHYQRTRFGICIPCSYLCAVTSCWTLIKKSIKCVNFYRRCDCYSAAWWARLTCHCDCKVLCNTCIIIINCTNC